MSNIGAHTTTHQHYTETNTLPILNITEMGEVIRGVDLTCPKHQRDGRGDSTSTRATSMLYSMEQHTLRVLSPYSYILCLS